VSRILIANKPLTPLHLQIWNLSRNLGPSRSAKPGRSDRLEEGLLRLKAMLLIGSMSHMFSAWFDFDLPHIARYPAIFIPESESIFQWRNFFHYQLPYTLEFEVYQSLPEV
jgi:hypothetical protein